WALKAMQNGRRCGWVDGFLEEQSCMSVIDFLRQRRRWFHGLVKTVLFAPVKLRWRLGLGLNTTLWALAPFAVVYTVCKPFYTWKRSACCGVWLSRIPSFRRGRRFV